MIELTITEIDAACGVALEDVERELARGVFINGGNAFMVSRTCGPALASSVARAAFQGSEVRFLGLTLGYPTYERVHCF
jgi:hypothetical protein